MSKPGWKEERKRRDHYNPIQGAEVVVCKTCAVV